MKIRNATSEDAEVVSSLVKSVAHYFTLHPEGLGAEVFLQSIEPQAIRHYITAPNFLYYAGFIDHRLAGVVAVRDMTHLYHLFVGQAFQGRYGHARICERQDRRSAETMHQAMTWN